METLRATRARVRLGTCACAALFLSVAFLGVTPGQDKKGTDKGVARTLNIKPDDLQVDNARKPIPFKKIDLAEIEKRGGKKVAPDAQMSLLGKKVKFSEYLNVLNKIEERLNAHGHSLRDSAKEPVKMSMKTKADPKLMAKQRDSIAALHRQAPPDRDKLVKAAMAKCLDKKQLPLLVKAAHANEEKLKPWHGEIIDKLNKMDTAKLNASEKKLHAELLQLSKKPTAVNPKSAKALNPLTRWHKEALTLRELFQRPDINVELVDLGKRTVKEWDNSWKADPPLDWSWGASAQVLGNTLDAEAHVRGNLETMGHAMSWFGRSQHSRAALDIGGTVLGNRFSVVDLLADFSSSYDALSQPPTSNNMEIHARLLGNDLFTPINQSTPLEFQFVDETLQAQVDLPNLHVNLAALLGIGDFVEVGATLKFGVKGNAHVTVGGMLSPSQLSLATGLDVGASCHGALLLDVGVKDVLDLKTEVAGTVQLVDESIRAYGYAGIVPGAGYPELDLEYSVFNRLSLLGGEITLEGWLHIWPFDFHGKTSLIRWDPWTPINGYVVGPTLKKVPLQ